MNTTHPFFPRHTFLAKGGGAAYTPSYYNPPPPAPVLQTPAPPAPPATTSSIEVTQSRIDAKRQAAAKKGLRSTILAGAERGTTPSPLGGSAGGKNTLLGGG